MAHPSAVGWSGGSNHLACEALILSCGEARKAVTYFYHNAELMRYDQFRAAGYMIGSGTVESGCKQIVSQRLNCRVLSGMSPGKSKRPKHAQLGSADCGRPYVSNALPNL